VPVHKYRDVSDMEDRTWRAPGDPTLWRAIAAAWDFAHRTTRPSFPPGVYRHRSLEEAEERREAWERRNFEAFRRRRAGSGA
jgi:hypothetical protein